ncbi:MAG TPA: hypothetical protein VF662_06540 [Allosphingosinicella sp.]
MFEPTLAGRELEARLLAALEEAVLLLRRDQMIDRMPSALEATAKRLYSVRRLRERYFAPDLLGEASWDILLDLYVARAEQRPVSISSACIGAAVPPTTALRWLGNLEEERLIRRYREGSDRRLVLVTLTDAAFEKMSSFLECVSCSHID